MEIKTQSGFEVNVPIERLDNMELLDSISFMDSDFTCLSKTVVLLLGKEDKTRLYNHLRLEDGRVPTEKVSGEIMEIFEKMGNAGKNL